MAARAARVARWHGWHGGMARGRWHDNVAWSQAMGTPDGREDGTGVHGRTGVRGLGSALMHTEEEGEGKGWHRVASFAGEEAEDIEQKRRRWSLAGHGGGFRQRWRWRGGQRRRWEVGDRQWMVGGLTRDEEDDGGGTGSGELDTGAGISAREDGCRWELADGEDGGGGVASGMGGENLARD